MSASRNEWMCVDSDPDEHRDLGYEAEELKLVETNGKRVLVVPLVPTSEEETIVTDTVLDVESCL